MEEYAKLRKKKTFQVVIIAALQGELFPRKKKRKLGKIRESELQVYT